MKKTTKLKIEKHKEINLDQFSKDADKLFKKYGLETGIIVSNYKKGANEYLLSCVNSNDEKEEAELLYATQELFSLVNLKSDYFSFLTNILKQLREKASKNTPEKEANSLIKKPKK